MPEYCLGIDTSCYTTSVALACAGRIVSSRRRLLSVPEGQRGLRQSEAVFQHVKALPELLRDLLSEQSDIKISTVAVSAKPEDREDSYMPVFQTGKAFAESIALSLKAPIILTTHQQGHIRAAMYDSGIPEGDFIALHLSGGTTKSILVSEHLSTKPIGGTSDLNAGQLVDRCGVMMGLKFPCGPELEKLAVKGEAKSLIPLSANGNSCSFSGAEAAIIRMINSGMANQNVAMEVYSYLERAIAKLINNAVNESGVKNILLAGGVASSALLREKLARRLAKQKSEAKLYWGKPELSGDNACGVALIGLAGMEEQNA